MLKASCQEEQKIHIGEIGYKNGFRAFFFRRHGSEAITLIGVINPGPEIKWVKHLDKKVFEALSLHDQMLILRYCSFFEQYKEHVVTTR